MTTVDVAVVGGGPAGLSAAIAAAQRGAQTVLLDEHATLGGQLRYRIADTELGSQHRSVRPAVLAAELLSAAAGVGVDLRPASLVWGLFKDNLLAVTGPSGGYEVRAQSIVLATGSTDSPFPFAGGSLPGVFSARGLQLLLHVHRVLPGGRFVVLGGGPEAAEVAADIRLAGADVVALFDPAGDHGAVVAEGSDGVQAAIILGQRHEADIIVVAMGRQPDAAMAFMAGCAGGYAASLGGFVPIRDDALRTSISGIFVAGDAAGICDVDLALAEGSLAGISAADSIQPEQARDVNPVRDAYTAVAGERIATASALQPTFIQV